MHGIKTLIEAMQQEFKVLMMVAEPPARLQMIRAEILMLTWLPGAQHCRTGQSVYWQCGVIDNHRRDCQ
jgi:hypothetical protein